MATSMTPEEIERFLDGQRTLVLVTLRPDGTPDPSFYSVVLNAWNTTTQLDGKLLVVWPNQRGFLRIMPNGRGDPSFNTGLIPTGQILAVGDMMLTIQVERETPS